MKTLDTGNMTRMSVKSMGAKEKATFELALSLIKWEPLYRLDSCNEKYVYYQTVIDKLIEICFPSKVVTRHRGDKLWITDGYRLLIRKRQHAHMRGDIAFDLINHNILLVKFKQYDLPPHIRRWIATFLLDRTQQVKIGNKFSPPGHPKGGVPQGTLLGSKCFLVYTNDLETPVPLYKYVDDSTLFEICHRKSESVLQHSVDTVARWDKSKEMLISFMEDPKFRSMVPRLIIDGNEIDNVQYAKLLWVTISSDLTWRNKHVENIVAKAGKRVYMLYQLKRAGIGQHDLVTILCQCNKTCSRICMSRMAY